MQELQKFEQENKEKLFQFLKEHNPGHDDIQIKHFIVGSGITDYGMFKQALAEINSHYEALKTNYVKVRRLELEKKILERDRSKETRELEQQVFNLDIEQKDLELETLQKQMERNLNELTKIFKLATEFEKKIEGKDRTELIKHYHVQRLAKLLAINTVWRGGNLSGVMDVITTLPKDMQDPLLQEFHNLQLTEVKNIKFLSELADTRLLEEKNTQNKN